MKTFTALTQRTTLRRFLLFLFHFLSLSLSHTHTHTYSLRVLLICTNVVAAVIYFFVLCLLVNVMMRMMVPFEVYIQRHMTTTCSQLHSTDKPKMKNKLNERERQVKHLIIFTIHLLD